MRQTIFSLDEVYLYWSTENTLESLDKCTLAMFRNIKRKLNTEKYVYTYDLLRLGLRAKEGARG